MSRPTLRMCVRCERTTETPVLVHEVHAPTGPGFNVYACAECADHYPPLTDVLELIGRGETEIVVDDQTERAPRTSTYPQRACPTFKTPR
jgi:hypothetical protein